MTDVTCHVEPPPLTGPLEGRISLEAALVDGPEDAFLAALDFMLGHMREDLVAQARRRRQLEEPIRSGCDCDPDPTTEIHGDWCRPESRPENRRKEPQRGAEP